VSASTQTYRRPDGFLDSRSPSVSVPIVQSLLHWPLKVPELSRIPIDREFSAANAQQGPIVVRLHHWAKELQQKVTDRSLFFAFPPSNQFDPPLDQLCCSPTNPLPLVRVCDPSVVVVQIVVLGNETLLGWVAKAKGYDEVDYPGRETPPISHFSMVGIPMSVLLLTEALGKVRVNDESWVRHHSGTLYLSSRSANCRASPAG
jgi:hypothetical protein